MSEVNLLIFGCVVSFIAGYALVQDLFARWYYRGNLTVEDRPSEFQTRRADVVEREVQDLA